MRWVLGVLTVLATVWCGLAAWLVLGSVVGDDSADPHGYARIFGVVMLVVGLPLLLAVAPPFVRRLRRPRS